MTNINATAERMTLPRPWRYRCFSKRAEDGSRCGLPATRWAPDPTRHDACTFYCVEHAPIGAEPIADDRPFLAVEIGGTIVVGGATTAVTDARRDALDRAVEALAAAGMTLHVVASAAGLLAPRTAPPSGGRFGALGGPRSRRR